MNNRELNAAMGRLAELQHGVLGRQQLASLGMSRAAVHHRIETGQWLAMTSRVVRVDGARDTFEQRCMAAVLDAGHDAVVCGPAAARLWGLPGFDRAGIEVTRLRRRPRRATAGPVHEPRLVPPHHRTACHDVSVTTPARTIFDLAGCVHPLRASRALDNALSRNLMTLDGLRSVAIELCRRGRKGSTLMRELLAARHHDFTPPESNLEARFLAIVAGAGLPLPDNQVDLGGDGWVGRVDFYDRARNLVVEIDSDIHHTSALDVAADEQRDAALGAAGFDVLRIKEAELDDPRRVLERYEAGC